MTINRDGQRPDSYQGLNPVQNPPIIKATRAPATGDRRYKIGTTWINTSANTAYFLTSVVAGSATWALASPGASDVDTLTGDGGGAISPAGGNITLAGGTNITTAGAGSTITFNLDAAISLATSVTSPLYTVAAATDLAITAVAGQDIILTMGDAAGANKVSFLDSAAAEVAAIDSNGGFSMGAITFSGLLTASASATIDTAGTALNLATDNSGDAVNIATGTVARAVSIGTSAAAHTVAIGNASAGAITIDTAAGVSIDAAAASNFTVAGAGIDLSLISGAGRVVINGEEAAADAVRILSAAGGLDVDVALQMNLASSQAAADAVRIDASNAAGGIDVDDGGGGMTFDSLAGISLDAAAASNFTVSGAGIDLTLASGGGRVVVNGEEAAADAIRLNSAAGGLDCDVALQLSLISSQAAVADAVRIQASAADGGIDIDSGTGGINIASTGVMDLDAAGALSINSSAGVINVGNDAVAQNINIGTGAAAREVTIGNSTGASGVTINVGTGNLDINGTIEDVAAKYVVPTGIDITLRQSPIMQSNATTGGAPTGATGDVNLMYLQEGVIMEQFIMGAGQTIIAPRMTSTGLNIALDQVDNEGAEYNFGAARTNSQHAFTIGTSAAFRMDVTLTVADVTGCEPLLIGFRKAEANNATITSYTDYALIGLDNVASPGNIVISTELNSGGTTNTNTTDAWADTASHKISVLVSAAGVVTYLIDDIAPSVTAAFTFDNADVVVPCLHFLNGADVAGDVELEALKIGFQ